MTRPVQLTPTIRPLESPRQRFMERQQELYGRGAEQAPSMLDLLVEKGSEVNKMQHRADSMVHELLTGGDVNSAEVLTAVQKADMAFRTMLQVRNKLVEAYREVQQIQV